MFSEKILNLRKLRHMTQEMAAAEFGVSRQAVQKWEAGSSIPEIGKLVEIARYFNVSLDFLVREDDAAGDAAPMNAARSHRDLRPSFDALHEWENYSRNMAIEYEQCTEEGKNVEHLRGLCEEIAKLPNDFYKDALADVVFKMIMDAPEREDYPYCEPSDYPTIHRMARHNPKKEVNRPLEDAILGAWLGRIGGCLLGKPVEGVMRDSLIPLLSETHNLPVDHYFNSEDVTPERCERYGMWPRKEWGADVLTAAPTDDDTNYLVLACLLTEKYGRNFTPKNVAEMWVTSQSKEAYCTAERVAFRNFVSGYLPPDSAIYKNPYREWIGAQIRGDFFGYINPGNPEAAAEMAFRDASISHVKNGIYGEMWISAMIAEAAVSDDIVEIIWAGLNEIPSTSRLHKQIVRVLDSYAAGKSFEETMNLVYAQYDDHNDHHWCHTISNAMIVASSLLYGGGDYGKSICMAVQSGFDTDCNGATVGSVMGMKLGAAKLPAKWTEPLHGRLQTEIFGVGTVDIADMAARTIKCMA